MSQVIETKSVTITTVGEDRSATGNATISDVNGFLLDLYLDWHASAPASSVATLTYGTPSYGTIVAAPAGNTDTLLAPRNESCSTDGSSTGLYDCFVVNGSLVITVTLSNALAGCLVATIRYIEM